MRRREAPGRWRRASQTAPESRAAGRFEDCTSRATRSTSASPSGASGRRGWKTRVCPGRTVRGRWSRWFGSRAVHVVSSLHHGFTGEHNVRAPPARGKHGQRFRRVSTSGPAGVPWRAFFDAGTGSPAVISGEAHGATDRPRARCRRHSLRARRAQARAMEVWGAKAAARLARGARSRSERGAARSPLDDQLDEDLHVEFLFSPRRGGARAPWWDEKSHAGWSTARGSPRDRVAGSATRWHTRAAAGKNVFQLRQECGVGDARSAPCRSWRRSSPEARRSQLVAGGGPEVPLPPRTRKAKEIEAVVDGDLAAGLEPTEAELHIETRTPGSNRVKYKAVVTRV